MKIDRVNTRALIQRAVLEYLQLGISDPIETARLLDKRGCIVAAVRSNYVLRRLPPPPRYQNEA